MRYGVFFLFFSLSVRHGFLQDVNVGNWVLQRKNGGLLRRFLTSLDAGDNPVRQAISKMSIQLYNL